MNIITNVNIKNIGTPTVYVVCRKYATVTLNYNNKNGLDKCKSY